VVVVGVADHLKPIPDRAAIAQLERVDRRAGTQQPHANPEFVLGARPVDPAHRFEVDVLEPLQTKVVGGGGGARKLPPAGTSHGQQRPASPIAGAVLTQLRRGALVHGCRS
jgi:hypothetical protein